MKKSQSESIKYLDNDEDLDKSDNKVSKYSTTDTYFDTINKWVFDQKKVVSFKLISMKMKISFNKAKVILQDYKDNKSSNGDFDIQTVYLLSGLNHGGDKQVFLGKPSNLIIG